MELEFEIDQTDNLELELETDQVDEDDFLIEQIGEVIKVGDGVAEISGLAKVRSGEMVEFCKTGLRGMALNLNLDSVGVVIFGEDNFVKEGDIVKRTGQLISVPVGDAMLNRVVNALGQPIDGQGGLEDVC